MSATKRFLRLKEVEQKVGMKRDTIYRGAREGWFPKPVKITDRCTGWVESELDEYIDAAIRASRSTDGAQAAPLVPIPIKAPAGSHARAVKARKAGDRRAGTEAASA